MTIDSTAATPMTTMSSTNGLIACTPFTTRHVEKTKVGGMVLISNSIELQDLTVVFPATDEDCKHYQPGAKVWLRGDLYTQKWAKDIYTIGGKTFILVPKNFIQLVDVSPYVSTPGCMGACTLKAASGGVTNLNPTAIFVDGIGNMSVSGNYTTLAGE
jgi:hypothetical protein